jgi:uncharacterized protein
MAMGERTGARAGAAGRGRARRGAALIDADVHQTYRSIADLFPYLERRWVAAITESGFTSFPKDPYYTQPGGGQRLDARPADGGPPGSDRALLRRQLLDAYDMTYAILTGVFYNSVYLPNPAFMVAVNRAINDWTVEHWLGFDRRLRGCLTVPLTDPAAAVAEIDRLGDHPEIVGVVVAAGSRLPYGNPHYHPIWEACARHDLTLIIHFGGIGVPAGNPPSPAGWSSFYIEYSTNMPQAAMAQMASLVTEGVFEKYPRLRVAILECGLSWVPHVMWRLDRHYRALRAEAPLLRRLPSEYIADHFWYATQPIEEPERPEHLLGMFELLNAERRVMFSSDYPHWDFDSPTDAVPRMPPALKHRIMAGNAADLFGLPLPPADGE